ncbi:hypothetical protein BEWA_025570 [Theileria equi strain WA]|uniref:Uncharacterized protein n=1 Tax=Theileria equi strain WA TaxID=1537102 RepID=L0AWS6_THEEQ|nr:hypothetical protein BEWA_025570 [Theileria equi strain WA]AFZ79708.1 hypothetical protein BEWA_025570 [Theileria equi strain WA]|eukprot:XP_004829374.1 hypothetical protein BEWA_025570 [Theileria equi strain WA]
MSKGPKELRLEIGKKCGKDGPRCRCSGNKPGDITASKVENNEDAVGFLALVHDRKGKTFRLSRELDNDENIGDVNQCILGVTKVSVYYWEEDKECNTPLLLEVVKGNHNSTQYYYRYDKGEVQNQNNSQTIWQYKPEKMKLQVMLDDRNCGRNHAVPLNIKDLATGTLPDDIPSTCMKKTRRIELGSLQHLTGSEYVYTTYEVKGSDTKISRVKVGDHNISGITIPPGGMDKVRLYSNTGISQAPIMINFNTNNRESKWFYSTNSNGTQWTEVGSTSNFYSDDGKPTEALAKKLDEFACQYHSGVTIDLSHSTSTAQNNYCCSQHKDDARISVSSVQVSCQRPDHNKGTITAYKHSIDGNGLKLVGIKFYPSGDTKNRKHVKSRKLSLPIPGPVDVYVFYCTEDPILVYVDRNKSGSPGWFRKSTKNNKNQWTKFTFSGITPTNITECGNWNKLVGAIKKLKCENFKKCPTTSLLRAETSGGVQAQIQDEDDIDLGSSEEEDTYKQGTDAPPPSGKDPLGPRGNPGIKCTEKGAQEEYKSKLTSTGINKGETGGVLSSDLWKTVGKAVGKTVDLGLDLADQLGSVAVPASGLAGIYGSFVAEALGKVGIEALNTVIQQAKPATAHQSEDGRALSSNTDDADSTTGNREDVDGSQSSRTTQQHVTEPAATAPNSSPPEPTAENFVGGATLTAGLGVIFGSSSGTLAGAGGLTGLGWWAFKRSKGDPWVRRGYPIEFLKNVPY